MAESMMQAGRQQAVPDEWSQEAWPPPRVLHVITTLDAGGTEEMVLSLGREQQRLGCDVEVAVLRGAAPLAPRFVAAGIPVHHMRFASKLSPGGFLRLRRLLRRGGHDVVHSHLDLADLYTPFATGEPPPVVVSSRHNTDEWRVRPDWKKPLFLLWERAAHRRTGAALAVSAAVRDFLVREEGLLEERFTVVANGIDLARFAELPSASMARQELAGIAGVDGTAAAAMDRPLLACVGRLARQKGVDVLLEAMAQLDAAVHLVLLGEGPEEDNLRRRAAAADLRGRVSFAGHQDRIERLLPAFTALVMPSRWEGFGLAAAEAMACGLPVVATDIDGLREVVEDGVTGHLVPPQDARALAGALTRLLADPLASRLGVAGRQRALQHFSAARMARDVLAVYRRLLQQEGRGPGARVLALTRRQIDQMWTGILPPRWLARGPGYFLAQQERDYREVGRHVEEHVSMPGRTLLDLGCGLGSMLQEGRRRGAAVIGVEPDADSLRLCQARLAREGGPAALLLAAAGERLPVASGSVDIVTCCSVLEHVQDPAAVLAEVARILRPGGWLYLGVPNALSFQERHYKIFLPPGTPRWLARLWVRLHGRDPAFLDTLHELTPGRTRSLAEQAGLQVVDAPVERRLQRLQESLAGRAQPARRGKRWALAAVRRIGGAGVLRGLIRRGFFVSGALLARRPPFPGSE